MNAIAMNAGPGRAQRDFAPKSRFGPVAIGVMVAFHGLVGYALINGLGKHVIEIVKKPLEATIVQEVQLPPPPPPPPPKQIVKQQLPKPQAPPPPAYVPPPEVTPPVAEAAPAITAVQTTTPAPPPPAAPPPVADIAPALPAPVDIKLACPTQVAPEMPQRAIEDGVSGAVVAQATIRDGAVVDVKILSGPRALHAAVRAAMLRYRCESRGEVTAKQTFQFRVE